MPLPLPPIRLGRGDARRSCREPTPWCRGSRRCRRQDRHELGRYRTPSLRALRHQADAGAPARRIGRRRPLSPRRDRACPVLRVASRRGVACRGGRILARTGRSLRRRSRMRDPPAARCSLGARAFARRQGGVGAAQQFARASTAASSRQRAISARDARLCRGRSPGPAPSDASAERDVRQSMPRGAPHGTDGCGIPVIGIPLAAMARGMARMADTHGLPTERATAARRLLDAMAECPVMSTGPADFRPFSCRWPAASCASSRAPRECSADRSPGSLRHRAQDRRRRRARGRDRHGRDPRAARPVRCRGADKARLTAAPR